MEMDDKNIQALLCLSKHSEMFAINLHTILIILLCVFLEPMLNFLYLQSVLRCVSDAECLLKAYKL